MEICCGILSNYVARWEDDIFLLCVHQNVFQDATVKIFLQFSLVFYREIFFWAMSVYKYICLQTYINILIILQGNWNCLKHSGINFNISSPHRFFSQVGHDISIYRNYNNRHYSIAWKYKENHRCMSITEIRISNDILNNIDCSSFARFWYILIYSGKRKRGKVRSSPFYQTIAVKDFAQARSGQDVLHF